jgi:MYXO-CTERM domain-containing protein
MFGIVFQNNTGRTINSLYIGYTGEQWRQGTSGGVGVGLDRLDFSYKANTTTMFGTGWTDFNALDFTTPNTTSGANVALDGNAAGNFTLKGSFITGLNIPNGQSFGIRWRDSNGQGTDDGLAIDDLIVMVPEAWHPAAVAGFGLLGLAAWQRRRSAQGSR